MSSDPIQLIPQLLRSIERGQNQQILSVSGTANQTLQPNQGALSSDGPNVSQTFQVANSAIHQVTYNFHLIGLNSSLGARAIGNGDHGAYPNHLHQNSQSTVISYASQPTIETSRFIGSNSVQNVQPSDPSVDHEDFNAKLAAFKESTVKLGRFTAELRVSTLELAEAAAKLSEWVTALNWPTLKLGLVSGPAVTSGDLAVKYFMSAIKISRSMIEFGRLSVKFGESTVRDSDSISLVAFDTLPLKLGETTARYRESFTRYDESRTRHTESLAYLNPTGLDESVHALDESEASRLRELIKSAVDFDAIEEMGVELEKSFDTFTKSLNAFGDSVVAYTKSITALDDFNVKLAAVKESTVEVRKSTAELKGSTVECAEATAKFSEWITALNWPTIKLGLVNESDVTLGDFVFKHSMTTIKLSWTLIEFGRSTVKFGESIIDSMTTVGESISLVVFDASTLKLKETTARYKESCTSYTESLNSYIESLPDTTGANEDTRTLKNSLPRLRELVGPVVDFDGIEEIAVKLQESADTMAESLAACDKSINALNDLLATFNRQNQ